MKKNKRSIKPQTITSRARIYWLFMILAALAAIILVLSIFGIFSYSDKQLQEVLKQQQENTEKKIEEEIDLLTARSINLSEEITFNIKKMLNLKGRNFESLNDDVHLITELEKTMYKPLYLAMECSQCSGAFIILDATCNSSIKNAKSSRMGLYLKYVNLSGLKNPQEQVTFFRGVAEIARMEKVEMHNRWKLEFDSSLFPGYSEIINTKPSRLALGLLWTERLRLTGIWEKVSLFASPILDENGEVIGVCGLEISDLYFKYSFPSTNSYYGSMLTVLATLDEDKIVLDKAMIGDSKDFYFSNSGELKVEKGEKYNKYKVKGKNYLGIHKKIKTKINGDKPLVVLTMVSEENYLRIAKKSYMLWIVALIVFLVLMLFIAWILSRKFIKPIKKGLNYKANVENQGIIKSGIREIDEFLEYVEGLNKQNGDLPENIEQLLCEFSEKVKLLTPTENKVFQLYISGNTLQEISEILFISMSTAKTHNTKLNKKLGVKNREELMLYIDLFRRCDRLQDICFEND